MNDYNRFSDPELIVILHQGDKNVIDFLMEKYKYLVRKKANHLFLLGGETDDLIQEGMIGLFKAIRDYDESQGVFRTFADLCITRQMYTAIEAAARLKHGPLNNYISLSADNDDSSFPVEYACSSEVNPEDQIIRRENWESFLTDIKTNLSKMERKVFDLYIEGYNYRQIAEEMGKSDKAIDNAIQRIKKKASELGQ